MILLIFAFILVALWDFIVVTAQSGEQAVYWSRLFGGTSDAILGEGTHLKFPWDEVTIYSTRVNELSEALSPLTRDGLSVDIRMSVRFQAEPSGIPRLHQQYGPIYPYTLLLPEAISALREIIGNHSAEEIYWKSVTSLVEEAENAAQKKLAESAIRLDRILILSLALPKSVEDSIIHKKTYEQIFLSYRFRNEAEAKERDRKEIEAEGIRQFEEISKISILKWRGLEATNELARSPNTRITILGGDQKGLPLLLNIGQ